MLGRVIRVVVIVAIVLRVVKLHDDALSLWIAIWQLLDSWRLEGVSLYFVGVIPSVISRSVDRCEDWLFSNNRPHLLILVADCTRARWIGVVRNGLVDGVDELLADLRRSVRSDRRSLRFRHAIHDN